MTEVIRTITFGIIAYNEHNYLPDLLEDLLNQTYPKELIEVIMVDGRSEDDTKAIMECFREQHQTEYLNIRILTNEKRIQPAGWNMVISNMQTQALLRIDAHARLPKDFVEQNIRCLNTGEYVCGGPRENIIDEDTAWKRMLLDAEQSVFGAGIASYRQDTEETKSVKSVFHGAYRKSVFDNVGLFNENLVRTEDNEIHYRIRQAGYRICYDPKIRSYYQTRNSLKGMIRQKYQNGLWIGKTFFICPGCISLFHLVPFAFVCAIIGSSVLAAFGIFWPCQLLWGAYLAATLVMTAAAVIGSKKKSLYCLVLPVVFLLLHVSYGAGTLSGIFQRKIK